MYCTTTENRVIAIRDFFEHFFQDFRLPFKNRRMKKPAMTNLTPAKARWLLRSDDSKYRCERRITGKALPHKRAQMIAPTEREYFELAIFLIILSFINYILYTIKLYLKIYKSNNREMAVSIYMMSKFAGLKP